MTYNARRILVIQGHPDPAGQHFCHALARVHAQGAAEAGHSITTMDVARLTVPFLRNREGQHRDAPEAIVQAQAAIRDANHVLMIYSVWNGTAPEFSGHF
jgi:putative NADPH-quinone reductase